MSDSLVTLSPSVQKNAWVKLMISGKAGSGKTRTSAEIVAGAMKRAGLKGPACWFATEPGIDFVLPIFEAAGIECLEFRPYELADQEREAVGDFELFRQFIKAAIKAGAQAVIVDSMTHVWDNFVRREGPKGDNTRPEDWAVPNAKWAKLLDFLATRPFHVAICTRAGDEWGLVKGKLGKTGGERSKIKGESDFEFSLILDMFRQGSHVVAKVRKERSLSEGMEGKEFRNPKFDDFEEVWRHMAFGSNGGSGPESTAPATKLDAPAGPAPRPEMFEALELREGWSWPAEAQAYERPWGEDEHDEPANAAFLENCANDDRDKKRDQSGKTTVYQIALAGLRAGWTPEELKNYIWRAEGWNKIALRKADELFGWISKPAGARAKAFEEEGAKP